MNKPLTVARKEFIDNIISVINGSGLPAFVMEDILKACLTEMSALANKQYQADFEAYQKENEKTEE